MAKCLCCVCRHLFLGSSIGLSQCFCPNPKNPKPQTKLVSQAMATDDPKGSVFSKHLAATTLLGYGIFGALQAFGFGDLEFGV